MPPRKRTLSPPGPAAPLKRGSLRDVSAAAKPLSAPRDAAILAEPRELPHAEVYRRVTERGIETTLATVARVRRLAYGHREAGRTPSGDAVLLATLRTVAERHGVEPSDVIVAGARALATARRRPAPAG